MTTLSRPQWFLPGALLALLVLLVGAGCRGGAGSGEPIVPGTYYTQFPLRLDNDLVRSTNYRTEQMALLPINTVVQVVGSRGARTTVALEGGREFRFEHIAKHTQDTAFEAFGKAFGAQPVDLSRYNEEELAAIEQGRAAVGMDREGVLAAMGPPPATGTLSLDSTVWKYWSNRFATFNVIFNADGFVTQVGQ